MKRTIEIDVEDAETIRAVLLTHAEMQNQRVNETQAVQARINTEGNDTEEEQEMVNNLQESCDELEIDSANLTRIADLFGGEGVDARIPAYAGR